MPVSTKAQAALADFFKEKFGRRPIGDELTSFVELHLENGYTEEELDQIGERQYAKMGIDRGVKLMEAGAVPGTGKSEEPASFGAMALGNLKTNTAALGALGASAAVPVASPLAALAAAPLGAVGKLTGQEELTDKAKQIATAPWNLAKSAWGLAGKMGAQSQETDISYLSGNPGNPLRAGAVLGAQLFSDPVAIAGAPKALATVGRAAGVNALAQVEAMEAAKKLAVGGLQESIAGKTARAMSNDQAIQGLRTQLDQMAPAGSGPRLMSFDAPDRIKAMREQLAALEDEQAKLLPKIDEDRLQLDKLAPGETAAFYSSPKGGQVLGAQVEATVNAEARKAGITLDGTKQWIIGALRHRFSTNLTMPIVEAIQTGNRTRHVFLAQMQRYEKGLNSAIKDASRIGMDEGLLRERIAGALEAGPDEINHLPESVRELAADLYNKVAESTEALLPYAPPSVKGDVHKQLMGFAFGPQYKATASNLRFFKSKANNERLEQYADRIQQAYFPEEPVEAIRAKILALAKPDKLIPTWEKAEGKFLFKAKGDIEEFMEKVGDPVGSVIDNSLRLHTELTYRKMASDVARLGTEEGLLQAGQRGQIASKFLQRFAPDGDMSFLPEINQWAAKELDERAFEHAAAHTGWQRVWHGVASGMRATKVLGSATAYPRNFWGAMTSAFMAGTPPWAFTKDAAVSVWRSSLAGDFPELAKVLNVPYGQFEKDLVDKAVQLGVVKDGARGGEAMFHIERLNQVFAQQEFLGTTRQAVKGVTGPVTKALGGLFSAGDDIVRAGMWMDEAQKYAKALAKQGETIDVARWEGILEDAAGRVRSMMPTHSEAYLTAHRLKTNPVLASYPVYSAEVYRNVGNIITQMGKEWSLYKQSGNKAWLGIAGQRLAGLAGGMASRHATSMALQFAKDQWRQGVLEDYVQTQTLVAPYDRATGYNVIDVDRQNKSFTIAVQGSLHPLSHITKPWETALMGAPEEDMQWRGMGVPPRLMSMAVDGLEPFVATEVWLDGMMRAYQAAGRRGGEGFASQAGAFVDEIGGDVNAAFAPPVVKQVADSYKALTGGDPDAWARDAVKYTGVSIRKYSMKEEGDYQGGAYYALGDLGRRYDGAHSAMRRLLNDPDATPSQKLAAAQERDQALESISEDYKKLVESLRYVGMTDNEIRQIARSKKLHNRSLTIQNVENILAGRPLTPRAQE